MSKIKLFDDVSLQWRTHSLALYDKSRQPDLLDFFISRDVSNNYAVAENLTDLSSNHIPVLLSISSKMYYLFLFISCLFFEVVPITTQEPITLTPPDKIIALKFIINNVPTLRN